jgi:GNAT superfamily N-acetyltransferase
MKPGRLLGIFVSETKRRLGIGRSLLQKAKQDYPEEKYKLLVDRHDATSTAFYDSVTKSALCTKLKQLAHRIVGGVI